MEIKPMLLTETWDKSALDDAKNIYQEKFNGIRALVHIKDGKVVGIRNRSNHPILYLFPEFRNLTFSFQNGILDTEICCFRDVYIDAETGKELTNEEFIMKEKIAIKITKSSFYSDKVRGIPGIDRRRSAPDEKVQQEYPATMVVFDALKIDDETLVMKPYHYRYEKLKMITDTDKIKVAKNFNGRELWEKVVKENLEGVVIKCPNGLYEIDKRSKNYIKMKNYKIADVMVEKTKQNEKGTKIFGKSVIDGKIIEVECQIPQVFDIPEGTIQTIKYLDVVGKRLIQPTVINRKQEVRTNDS